MMVMAAGLPPVWADGESYDVSIVYSGNLDGGQEALGVQWSDLSYGPEFLETTPLPWTASNWIAKDDIQSQRSITRAGRTLRFFAWLDPGSSPFRHMAQDHQVVNEDINGLAQGLRQARQPKELVGRSTPQKRKQ